MSFRPFTHLPAIQYFRNDGPDIGAGPVTSVTPACIIPNEIDAVLDLLCEIDQAHQQDLEANADWLPDRWMTSTETIHGLRQAGSRLSRFKAREVWRIGSYIMFWCSLEDIVEHEYRALLDLLEWMAPQARAALEAESSIAVASRCKEVEPVREYRNKIFAHTAYAKPLIREKRVLDSSVTQLTSLVYFTGSDYLISKAGLALGGTTVVPDAYGIAPHFHSGPQRFAAVILGELTEKAVEHFVAWWSMYKAVLDALQGIPDVDVRAACPAIERVVRQPVVLRPGS